ncbi:hypothetical protein EsDP_00002824 [Epichloe bromicola]|uniref:PAC domain-containing protein n=1 Tax=Epichloe bromicola TaxID=79588 RepID=A0ABQ0CLZ4_9HYPO
MESKANDASTRAPSLNFDGFDGMSVTPGLAAEGSPRRSQFSPARSLRSQMSHVSLADSAADSTATSASTSTSSVVPLPALQIKGEFAENGLLLHPLPEEELDPGSFDIVAPLRQEPKVYSLAKRSEDLFSKEHMSIILGDARLLGQFSRFLADVRPRSLPLLTYYLDADKAIRAIDYANSVAAELEKLDGYDFASGPADRVASRTLEAKHDAAFEALAREELPMFITHVWIRIVSLSIKQRVMGTMPPHLREASSGLAEVFCLTDPSRHDNPIILASSEFHRTTQYGISDVIGRNCRFLQGPGTNPLSVRRIRAQLEAGKEHFETFLNYRRDGSPFMNLLLCAPLIDSRGTVRYFLGAQVDVSGLARECAGLDGLKRLVRASGEGRGREKELPSLSNHDESERPMGSALSCRGDMGDEDDQDDGNVQDNTAQQGGSCSSHEGDTPYHLVLEDGASSSSPPPPPSSQESPAEQQQQQPANGRLTGVYENYLLVRASPGLPILFASPTLRVPGMLQSALLSRIGGSGRVRDQLAQALGEGRGVTAKVQWLPLSSARRCASALAASACRGRPRWLHCTPLRGIDGVIGVWMVVVVDDDDAGAGSAAKHPAVGAACASGQPSRVAPAIETRPRRGTAAPFGPENDPWPFVWQG